LVLASFTDSPWPCKARARRSEGNFPKAAIDVKRD
jgi:hypothetical protein